MTYSLEFHEKALKEWAKLGETVRTQLKDKLAERLKSPHIPASRLYGAKNRYKIKLRQSGFRLVYEVRDKTLIVAVIAIGKREKGKVYATAAKR